MNTKLDLLKLSKGMDVKDKAKLLFAHTIKRFETMGKERLLNPIEIDALMRDAHKNNQINHLNELIDAFNLTGNVLSDVKIKYLNFLLKKSRLEIAIAGILIRNHYGDIIDFMLYDVATEGYSNEQMERADIQKKIDKKSQALREKYKIENDFSIMFDHFSPPFEGKSYFTTELVNNNYQPNTLIQEAFMNTVKQVVAVRKAIYKLRYLSEMSEMELLDEELTLHVVTIEEDLSQFEKLEGLLFALKIYQLDDVIKDFQNIDLKEPQFVETIKDINKATQLSESDLIKAREEVNTLLDLIRST